MFGRTNVLWTSNLVSMFRVLSVFYVNLEIMAPECAASGLT